MAAHRYWRIFIITTGSPWAGIAELELRTSPGGTDRTVPGGAAYAPVFTPGYPPSNVVDNNPATLWATFNEDRPYWWSYDFGPGVAWDIREIYLTPRQDGFYYEAPQHFTWEWSDNGTTWTVQREVSGLTWTAAAQAIDVSGIEVPDKWIVAAQPLVRWIPHVPVLGWTVRAAPDVTWIPKAYDTRNAWTVETSPSVQWVVKAGAATTDCAGGDGVVPPPDEPPPESNQRNYVF